MRGQKNKLLKQINLVHKVNQKILSTLNLEKVFGECMDSLQKIFHYHSVALYLVSSDGKYLNHAANSVNAKYKKKKVDDSHIPIKKGVVGKVFRTGETVILGDVRKEKTYFEVFPQTKSEICCPLRIRNKIIGVINIESDKRNVFSSEDSKIISLLADSIANAITNARLFGELRQSEEEYRLLVENMNEAVWRTDRDERTVYISPKFKDLLGYAEEEVIGKKSYNFIRGRDRNILDKHNEKRQAGKSSKYEITLVGKSGEKIPVLISGAPMPDGGTMGIITDLRKEKKTEHMYQTLVEKMNEGLWVGDKDEHPVYINPKLSEMIGYSINEIKGKTSYDLVDEEGRRRLMLENKKRHKGRSSEYELTFVSKRGRKVPVWLSGAPLPDGGTVGIMTDLRKIKEQEKKISDLKEQEHNLAVMTNDCIDAIIAVDKKKKIKWWNKGAQSVFGYKWREVLGKPLDILMPDDKKKSGEIEYLFEEVDKTGFIRDFETVRLHRNKTPIIVSKTMTAFKDDKTGDIKGYSVIYRDITAKKKWEEELQDRYEKIQDAYKELGRKGRQVDYLVDMLDIAIGDIEVGRISDFIVSAAVMLTRADACTLRLYNHSAKTLNLKATYGIGRDWYGRGSIDFKGSLAEKSLKEGHPLKIPDVGSEKLYGSPKLARKYGLTSLLVIPLMVKNEIIGVLKLYISRESKFSVLDDEFIITFAKQASIALKLSQG